MPDRFVVATDQANGGYVVLDTEGPVSNPIGAGETPYRVYVKLVGSYSSNYARSAYIAAALNVTPPPVGT